MNNKVLNFGEFVAWEQKTHDTLDIKKIYIDMAEDILAGMLLSQIVYWYLPSKDGGTKLRVKKDGHFWIAKTQEEWHEELRFTKYNLSTAAKKLENIKIIETKIYKFGGAPTKHYRLNISVFLELWQKLISAQISANSAAEFDYIQYLSEQAEPAPNMDLMDSSKTGRTAPNMDLMDSSNSICCNAENPFDGFQQNLNREYDRNYKQTLEDEEKQKQVSAVTLSNMEIESIERALQIEFAEMIKEGAFKRACNKIRSEHAKGKVKVSYEGILRSELEKRIEKAEKERQRYAERKQNPQQGTKGRGRTRTEMTPEWLDKKEEPAQAPALQDTAAIEQQRQLLAQELQKFKKAK